VLRQGGHLGGGPSRPGVAVLQVGFFDASRMAGRCTASPVAAAAHPVAAIRWPKP